RFVDVFPDVGALASASRADVLRAWGSLGYNRRAISLHAAAGELLARHDGRLPSDPDALRSLPGVGPYTAAAVASIAFGAVVPAADSWLDRARAARAIFCVALPARTGARSAHRAGRRGGAGVEPRRGSPRGGRGPRGSPPWPASAPGLRPAAVTGLGALRTL